MGATYEDPNGRGCDRSQKEFVGELSDGRNQRIGDTHTVGAIGASLAQAFHRLPQAAAMADRNHQVAFPEQTNFVYDFRGRRGAGDRQPKNDQQMFQKLHQVGSQIAAEQDNLPGGSKVAAPVRAMRRGSMPCTRRFKFLTSWSSDARTLCRNGGLSRRAGLHGIQRGRVGDG